jgi:hypothetical protein
MRAAGSFVLPVAYVRLKISCISAIPAAAAVAAAAAAAAGFLATAGAMM